MADCDSLLDEELSSFVFNYLTENSGSQYGEEEVCSDRLDADFSDIDLSQLDASDFDSVNCLSELHWCNDQSDVSSASIHYSTGDSELFEIEENAALLAALTDSLDGMVEDVVGGLSVFPSLGEEPGEEEDLPFPSGSLSGGSLSPETEDPSLLKKLLLSPPNVPTGLELNKESSSLHRHSSRNQNLKPVRPLAKRNSTQERRPRVPPPAGRLCTELHRHLTTAQEAEDTPSADTEEEEEEEDEEEDSESEDEEDEVEEEDESSSSEGETSTPPEPAKPQFTSEKELQSMVELIKYMHTYCLPTRKQAAWDRKERECPGQVRRARPECPPARIPSNCHKAAPQVQSSASRPRLAFTRRREVKANSLLRELLETVNSFDVSQPYRLHSPPYTHDRGATAKPARDRNTDLLCLAAHSNKPELAKDPAGSERDRVPEAPQSPYLEDTSFSVRRSRRLASFPSRFAKKGRASRLSAEPALGAQLPGEEDLPVKHPLGDDPGMDYILFNNSTSQTLVTADPGNPCCQQEKRACLCLPLTPKSTGDTQYANKPFEQTLGVELCGTAGLTPPTTPPHKPVEDELFKPEVKGESPPKGSWLNRTHSRKLPEQTELYAQLRKMGQASDTEPKVYRTFGDHDYCLLSLGESRKRSAAMLSHSLFRRSSPEEGREPKGEERLGLQLEDRLSSKTPEHLGIGTRATAASPQSASPHNSDEEGECSSRSPSPVLHSMCCQPHSPSSRPDFRCENSEMCYEEKQKNKISKSLFEIDEDNCQVFYIHNLPSSVTQTMLRKRFEAFGVPEDCKVITKNEERCGVIKFRQAPNGLQRQRRGEPVFQNGGVGVHRLSRKRYIDLDEAGPGPVKSKYDALDFDTLLKEAQKSLHR
ncbi:peroxisome proliferator-activated receptor gamma coactivator 1-beta isoform X2 [Esox lucius]|uniref:peroxisome proliferator-activated receptor gamma coactivator 1-beta isoform X2 n=1 Tax=Esox lucius TaxID=8010 RepID=UPI001476C659|nr:peroxisome proliferator-activated receptor gamma coactivator 1-beta isoform X2 [Esox lucius]